MKEKGEVGFNRLYGRYQKSAQENNRDWELSTFIFRHLSKGNCHYCGRKPQYISRRPDKNKNYEKHTEYEYNGVDRLDNTKGYTVDNCVSCCKICNMAKSDMLYNDFIDWVGDVKGQWENNTALWVVTVGLVLVNFILWN